MTKYTIISATTGIELACVWAGGNTQALTRAFQMFPRRRVAVMG